MDFFKPTQLTLAHIILICLVYGVWILICPTLLGLITGLCAIVYFLASNQQEKGYLTEKLLRFPDSALPCWSLTNRLLGYRYRECERVDCNYYHGKPGDRQSSLMQYLEILAMAKSSIDICVYRITIKDMTDFIIKLARKGIKVKIITDASGDDDDRNHMKMVGTLQKASVNIEVKTNIPDAQEGKMHHKFVIIDKKIGIFGSFNWSFRAITKNNETVFVSQQQSLVGGLNTEFNKLWSSSQRRNVEPIS